MSNTQPTSIRPHNDVCDICGRTSYWCSGHNGNTRYTMVPNPNYRGAK